MLLMGAKILAFQCADIVVYFKTSVHSVRPELLQQGGVVRWCYQVVCGLYKVLEK